MAALIDLQLAGAGNILKLTADHGATAADEKVTVVAELSSDRFKGRNRVVLARNAVLDFVAQLRRLRAGESGSATLEDRRGELYIALRADRTSSGLSVDARIAHNSHLGDHSPIYDNRVQFTADMRQLDRA